jgi:hypothetical protein
VPINNRPVDPARDKATMARWNAEALAEALDELATAMPSVARVLAALPLRQLTASEAVLWWTAANGWLSNRRPCDVLAEDPGAVEQAARHLAEPSAL